jgi:hypothetical protein
VEVIGPEIGTAAALKMCYAGWNKCSTALLAAILATANQTGVMEELKTAWSRGGPSFEKSEQLILRAAPKAWRWTAEMREIAATLESAGLPVEFHKGAEEIYSRLTSYRDSESLSLPDLLARIV